ncbi:MAG: hypothetical protein HMLIMOIP_001312 [Candidatus Nitrosomirales archaeon]|jgi:hypothetical protein
MKDIKLDRLIAFIDKKITNGRYRKSRIIFHDARLAIF